MKEEAHAMCSDWLHGGLYSEHEGSLQAHIEACRASMRKKMGAVPGVVLAASFTTEGVTKQVVSFLWLK